MGLFDLLDDVIDVSVSVASTGVDIVRTGVKVLDVVPAPESIAVGVICDQLAGLIEKDERKELKEYSDY